MIKRLLSRLWAGMQHLGTSHSNSCQPAVPAPTPRITQEQTAHSQIGLDAKEASCTVYAAYDKLIQHLDSKQIGYSVREDERSICIDLRGDVGTYRVYARVDPDDKLFQVFGYMPLFVPAGCRPAIAELFARVNFNLKVGKFEFDYDDGSYRFQVAQIMPDNNLADETIHRVIGTTMAMLDLYVPAVLSVVYGNETPQDAVLQADQSRGSSRVDEGGEPSADD